MVVYSGTLTTPGTSADIRIRLSVTESTKDPINNRTLMAWSCYLYRANDLGSPFNLNNNATVSASVNGSVLSSSSKSYDFRSPKNTAGSTVSMGSGTKWVDHLADGTKSIICSVSFTDGAGGTLGTGSDTNNTLVIVRLYRLIRLKVASVWEYAYVWIKSGGIWKRALPFVKSGGTWKNPTF